MKIEVRWKNEAACQLEELGIDSNPNDYCFKEININPKNVCFVYEYEGCCVIGWGNDEMVTSVKYTEENIAKLLGA